MKKSVPFKTNLTFRDGKVVTRGYGNLATSVFEDEAISRDAKALYGYLICKAGSSHYCYPANETIMKALNIKTKNSLRDYKDELEVKGLLRVENRTYKSGRKATNFYYPTKMLLDNKSEDST